MTELAKDNDDTALEWLFSKARKYPLLSADEEQAIDGGKWLALEQLQQQWLTDKHCRTYLRLWATNTLKNPPRLDDFALREHYLLLRRELVGLVEGGGQRAALVTFSKRIAGPPNETRDIRAITALQLPASLIAGLAETLADESAPRGVAAALRDWHPVWSEQPQQVQGAINAQTLDQMRQHLAHYYAAREQLVNHNLRLVFALAGRMTGRGVSYRDLIQNGVVGLIRAAEKFQHHKGYRFSTYAYNWINQSIRQSIEDQRGIVRYPAGVNEQISRMHRERMHLISTTGREPDLLTLAQRLQIEPDALQRLQQVGNLAISLDEPFHGDTEGLAMADTLGGGPFASTPARAEQISLNRCLMQRIGVLEPAEKSVVIQRWGLDHTPPLTRAEIAVQMHVSTEWVRQLETSALAKLRNDEGVVAAYRDYGMVD